MIKAKLSTARWVLIEQQANYLVIVSINNFLSYKETQNACQPRKSLGKCWSTLTSSQVLYRMRAQGQGSELETSVLSCFKSWWPSYQEFYLFIITGRLCEGERLDTLEPGRFCLYQSYTKTHKWYSHKSYHLKSLMVSWLHWWKRVKSLKPLGVFSLGINER